MESAKMGRSSDKRMWMQKVESGALKSTSILQPDLQEEDSALSRVNVGGRRRQTGERSKDPPSC